VTASGLEKGKKARTAVQRRDFFIFAPLSEMAEI